MAKEYQNDVKYSGWRTWFKKYTTVLFRTAVNEIMIAKMITNRNNLTGKAQKEEEAFNKTKDDEIRLTRSKI